MHLKTASNSEVSSPGKRKRLAKERDQKRKGKRVLRWEKDSSFYTHHFLSTGDALWAEAATEARHSSPCKWINPSFILPNLHVKNASVFGLSNSWEWRRIRNREKLVGCRVTFSNWNTGSRSLAFTTHIGFFCFFSLLLCVNTVAVLISLLCRHGCNIGHPSYKATVIPPQTCCDRSGPIQP